ncbi:MAG: deoxyribose-phosphate aldolase [Anaerolineales bacterium]|jgi:deoxyribose-phosphate aldolase|nr:deoxyribose-phosphate aldolase [Anaerolineales bacterium]
MMSLEAILELSAQYETQLPPAGIPAPLPQGTAIAAWIDHTLLKPEAAAVQVDQLCQEALQYQFAAVCINPAYVARAAHHLAGTTVKVCTVVGFPLGAAILNGKVLETYACLEAGAQEIDMVLNIGAIKSKEYGLALNDIQGVVQAAHNQGAIVKVILENALLTRREKILACLLCKSAGADFVKTSTGFAASGATPEDVELMRRVVGPDMGVKAAGGVRSYADALAMIRAGASRIGSSSSVTILQVAETSLQDNH